MFPLLDAQHISYFVSMFKVTAATSVIMLLTRTL